MDKDNRDRVVLLANIFSDCTSDFEDYSKIGNIVSIRSSLIEKTRCMNILKNLRTIISSIDRIANQPNSSEQQSLMLGRLLSESIKTKKEINSLSDVEFKVFSQFGDDGIIQWLINNLDLPHQTFVEFGVSNYHESNTRFLLMNDNWSGLVMDGSQSNVNSIISSDYFWRHELFAKAVFIDLENINFDKEVGILHIDLDGNDYWIWKEVNCISPIVVIVEYNSVFGIDRTITVPYDKSFDRNNAHYSNLYFGVSLSALHQLANEKGYSFIGCNSAGNNSYFVRKDKLNNVVKEVSLEEGYVVSKYRESRDPEGRLTYLTGSQRIDILRGMPVYNISKNNIEEL
jgi:hypothetical protein